jgi:hypothetical protein
MKEIEKEGFISFEESNPIKGSVVLIYFEDIDSYFIDTNYDYCDDNFDTINKYTQYSGGNDSGGGFIILHIGNI